MTDNDLFPDKDDQNLDSFELDPNTKYYEELVGEGKKFKDEEALARGKAESDAFIQHLQREMKNLKEDYLRMRDDNTSRARLEEMLKELKSASNSPSDDDDVNEANTNNKPVFDPNEVEKLIERKYSEIESTRRREANMQLVVGKLREKFGSNYRESLREQTRKLGLDDDFVRELAERSPEAFMKTLGLTEERNAANDFFAPPRSSTRSTSVPSTKQPTWSYYEKLRKEKPDVYYDNKIQIQMHKDAQRLGDAFFDDEQG